MSKPLAAQSSAVYAGKVRHRRFKPVSHQFCYRLFMLYLDLDELPSLFASKWYCSIGRFNLVSFRREDFFNPAQADLKQAVIERVESSLAARGLPLPSIQRVRMLCHVRYLNIIFNPVSFYYCFDERDQLVALLAEITNTPWGERHSYVLPVGQAASDMQYRPPERGQHHYRFAKEFHVSPFNPMTMQYEWLMGEPAAQLAIHMNNYLSGGADDKHFDATLTLEKHSFDRGLLKALIRFPLMTVTVVMGIYWQAFKLWCKRAPFYANPALAASSGSRTYSGSRHSAGSTLNKEDDL